MDLEIRHLRLVSVVAERQSLINASDALHLTQSALSHQLRDIEDRLSARLFLRGHRRMTLTAAGERLLRTARTVLKELRTVEQDITTGATGRIPLRLSVESCTRYHWLAPVVAQLHARHPLVDVSVDVEAAKSPGRALLEGTLDLAIVSEPVQISRAGRVVVRTLFEDELVMLMSSRHALARRPFVRVTDLHKERLLTFEAVPATDALVELVRAGAGVTIAPRWTLGSRAQDDGVKVIRLAPEGVFTTWHAAVARHLDTAGYITDFLRLFTAEVSAHSQQRKGT